MLRAGPQPRRSRGRPRSVARRRRGARRAPLVHAPAGAEPGTALPLVCMLHGCTQDAASFAAATRMNEAADRHGFVVGLSPAGPRRQPAGLLELVRARAPAARRRRTRVDRRERPRAHGHRGAVDDRPRPRLRRRPVVGRRDGGDPGRRLPGRVRRGRGAFRARVPLRGHHARRVRRDGPRRRGPGRAGQRHARGHGGPRPPRPEHGRPRQRRPHRRPGQRGPGAPAVDDRQPPRGARDAARSTSIARRTSRTAGSAAATPTPTPGGRTATAP